MRARIALGSLAALAALVLAGCDGCCRAGGYDYGSPPGSVYVGPYYGPTYPAPAYSSLDTGASVQVGPVGASAGAGVAAPR